MTALKDDGTSMGKVYELGGPEIFTVHELVTSDLFSLDVVLCITFTEFQLQCRQILCLM